MGKVFIDMAISLDGFVAGPNNEDAGLHDWYFAPEGSAPAVIDELMQSIGAMVLGRRAFGEQPEGFVHDGLGGSEAEQYAGDLGRGVADDQPGIVVAFLERGRRHRLEDGDYILNLHNRKSFQWN